MKTSEDARKYAAEQGFAEDEALKKGMEAKPKEYLECFPSVTWGMACKVLERSESALLAPASA